MTYCTVPAMLHKRTLSGADAVSHFLTGEVTLEECIVAGS
jgi:hypothetical protein